MTATRAAKVMALTLFMLACQVSQAADALSELINYREYSPLLSSSGQPTADQLTAVSEAGFERVVFLAFSDHDGSLANEDGLVKELGMEYAHIPVDWHAPTASDFYMFAGLMQRAPAKKTLVHCQVNFRASTFSFLYRVIYGEVPIDAAKDAMNTVWVPDETWRELIFEVLEDNGISPHCDNCLWE